MGRVNEAAKLIPGVAQVEAIVGGPKRAGALVGALAVTGALVGSGFSFDSSTEVKAGSGEVTKVYSMDQVCYAGYEAKMKDVEAKYSVSVKVDKFGVKFSVPTTYSEKVQYDGTIGNQVCHPSEAINLYTKNDPEYKKRKACAGKEICAVLKGKYAVTTFEKDPGKGYNVTGNGIARALTKNIVNDIHVIPGLGLKADGLDDNLRGLAFLEAQDTSSTSCLKAALPVVRKAEQVNLKKAITNQVNGAAGFYNASPILKADGSDVAVIDEASATGVTTQYSAKINQLKAKDDSLHMDSGSVGKCSVSPSLKNQQPNSGISPQAASQGAK